MKPVLPIMPRDYLDDAWALPRGPAPGNETSKQALRARELLASDFVSLDDVSRTANTSLRDTHNPLISASARLLVLILRIRRRKKAIDLDTLRQRFDKGLLRFTRDLLQAGLKREDVAQARYMLCAAADEAVMAAAGDSAHLWSANSLLARFHDVNLSGERFFVHLEHCLRNPHRHVWLLELMYVCLISGFQGRYGQSDGNVAELLQRHDELYAAIVRVRGDVDLRVSPGALPEVKPPRPALRSLPSLLIASALAITMGVLYTALDRALDIRRAHVLQAFTLDTHAEGTR